MRKSLFIKLIGLLLSGVLLVSCASTKSNECTENNTLVPPKKSSDSLVLDLGDVDFETPDNQKSGICFADVQDAENYLMNYNILYSYISQQKNIIDYYENAFYK